MIVKSLKLVPNSDPVLHQPALPWDFNNPPCDAAELVEQMTKIMKFKRGMGLAAPQIGLSTRMFIIDLALIYPDRPEIVAFFNPRITYQSEETELLVEGCLSFPNLWIKVKRPANVRLSYQDQFGRTQSKVLGGYGARCALHEFDHLEGIVFTERSHKFHLDQAMKIKKRLDRQHKEFQL